MIGVMNLVLMERCVCGMASLFCKTNAMRLHMSACALCRLVLLEELRPLPREEARRRRRCGFYLVAGCASAEILHVVMQEEAAQAATKGPSAAPSLLDDDFFGSASSAPGMFDAHEHEHPW